jgi:hypothetical protein
MSPDSLDSRHMPFPVRTSFPSALAALLALAAALPVARAHQAVQTNLYLDIELTESSLNYEFWVAAFLFPPLDDVTLADKENRPTLDERGEAIAEYFSKNCPVEIDGIPVKPVMDAIKWQDMEQAFHFGALTDFTMAQIKFHYPVKALPKNIKMRWGVFVKEPDFGWEGLIDPDQDPQELDLIIIMNGKEEYAKFSPTEPEVLWHAPVDPSKLFVAPLPPISDPVFTLPVASLLLGLAGLGFLLISGKGRIPKAIRIGVFAALAGGAVFSHHILSVEIPKFWAPSAPKLTDAEAVDTFKKLHENIYRAFDYDSEDDIYDALSQSVEGVLLDKIYTEVFQSLIRQEDGGAVAKVQKVDIVKCEALANPSNPDEYALDCRWRVHGFVEHSGHIHSRVNEYQARYTMAARGEKWKITGVQVNEQARLNPATLERVDIPADSAQ